MKDHSPMSDMVKRGCAVAMLGWVTWLNVTSNDGSEHWSITSATETKAQCVAAN